MKLTTGTPESVCDWRLSAAASLWSVTGLTALILAVRAGMGAFDAPVSAIVPGLMTAMTLAVNLCACRLFLNSRNRRSSPRGTAHRLWLGLVSLVAPAVAGMATAVNATPFALGVVAGILVLGLTVVIVSEGIRVSESLVSAHRIPNDVLTDGHVGGIEGEPECDGPVSLPWEATDSRRRHQFDSELFQQISRHRQADGTERIEAVLVAAFEPHSREVSLHLPIHPALRGTPHVECEPLDESAVTIQVTTAHAYGIRIEVKRDANLEETLSVPIGLEISTIGTAVNVA